MLKFSKTLYKRATNNKIIEWTVEVEDNKVRTVSGYVDGSKTQSLWKDCESKNIGKSNETTPQVQALREATSSVAYKIQTGYFFDIEEAKKSQPFEPMTAQNYKDYAGKITFPVLSQPKLDGIRCTIDINGMKSREGREIIAAPHIMEILKPLLRIFPTLKIDGELYNHDLYDDFNKIVSIVRKTKPTKEDLIESANIMEFHVYDCIMQTNDGFKDRLRRINSTIRGIHPSIVCVETTKAPNQKMLDALYDRYKKQGYEGQMIRNMDAPYQQKRTKDLLKRKEMMDKEFEIVEVLEGKGNRKGTAGMVVVKLDDGQLCRAGIKGDMAYFKSLWQNRQEVVGEQGTIQFQGYTPKGMLRFPVMKAVRNYE